MSNAAGRRRRFANFPSQYVPARHVDVWLPPDYDQSDASYPVLYMHDGQNLFDADTAYTGVAWGVDEVMVRLISAEKTIPVIIVGIWNTANRFGEYLPQQPHGDQPLPDLVEKVDSDNYLRFLVQELKPSIDKTFRTQPTKPHTHVMGSSMGGLISLYALCEYPDLFGTAGCISTHWPIMASQFEPYLQHKLPDPATHRIYFDYGTKGLDAAYEPYQLRVDKLMEQAGYSRGKNWTTIRFDNADHNEQSWRERIHIPLQFILGST